VPTVYALAVITVVVPFAGPAGKSRLELPGRSRRALALAMLGDVLAACVPVGRTRVATSDDEGARIARESGADVAADPGGGQGAAVEAALDGVEPGGILVVNADVPCVVPHDLRSLLAATPAGGIAFVEALDGTTNALSLPASTVFSPLYGPGSADRFREHAAGLGLDAVSAAIPNIAEDVDTLEDLHRLQLRCGPLTQACLAGLADGALR
jgi:2-phospho-L-lactate guanylyltransferase